MNEKRREGQRYRVADVPSLPVHETAVSATSSRRQTTDAITHCHLEGSSLTCINLAAHCLASHLQRRRCCCGRHVMAMPKAKKRPTKLSITMEQILWPPGLRMQTDFISVETEAELLSIFRALDWPSLPGRRSLHYGYTFSYKTFGIDQDTPYKPFPAWLDRALPAEYRKPDQVCVQHYPPGAGIPPHVDTHSAYDELYSLSLGAPVTMQFRHGKRGDRVDVDLPPRSMVQMDGDARLHWTHGIRARKTDALPNGTVRPRVDRWSITYRWLRAQPGCDCGNVELCDTAQAKNGIERELRWKQQA